jgi:hypothetical protein
MNIIFVFRIDLLNCLENSPYDISEIDVELFSYSWSEPATHERLSKNPGLSSPGKNDSVPGMNIRRGGSSPLQIHMAVTAGRTARASTARWV